MNKKDLAKEIASRMSTTVVKSLKFIDTLCMIMGETLEKNESVLIQNFGHYRPWQQTERRGRNPRTGTESPIRERLSVKFKPGKGLLNQLNKEKKNRRIQQSGSKDRLMNVEIKEDRK